MAKLYLKFEQTLLKEHELRDGTTVTIGRLPDNNIHIDNLAVSGHHARILWEGNHFVLEDSNSLNGTFVNNRRINRAALKHGDMIIIGKHTLSFVEEGLPDPPSEHVSVGAPAVPPLESTVVLDTRKAKEMLAHQPAGGIAAAARDRNAQLVVVDGKTDQPQYLLTGKLTVIGKSDMASIKLKGWFAPNVGAVINKNDGKYYITASEKDVKVSVNDAEVVGRRELNDGDVIQVAKVKLAFSYTD
jgi:pSer/pThr/pTyr-binding forkhead associated (FHA) protein